MRLNILSTRKILVTTCCLLLIGLLAGSVIAFGQTESTPNAITKTMIRSIVAVIAYILIFSLILAMIGHSKKLGFLGLIVDERGKYSLSRLQALAWTFLIGAAYVGIAVGALQFIGIPDSLLTLMGVSLGSAVVSQTIKTYKIDSQKTVKDAKDTDKISPALIDIVSEEETDYENRLSLGKFQMLIWTIISLAIYTIILLTSSPNLTLPEVTPTMVTLMGISQGTYLIHKIPS